MADVSTWSTTAASNNSASPDGFPEGMAPSGLNDSAREVMAALATWYADHAWVLRGRKSANQSGTQHTVAYASTTTFTTAAGDGDTTAIYHAGRRIRCEVTAGTVVGRIVSSTGNPTTVTVTLDSGDLDSGLDQVYLGPETTNPPIDASGVARSSLGGWSFVTQYTPSATASQDITSLDQSSDHLFLLRSLVPASDGASLLSRTAPDTAPTIDSGANDYVFYAIGGGGTTTTYITSYSDAIGTTALYLSGSVGNAATEYGVDGHLILLNPGDSSIFTRAIYQTVSEGSTSGDTTNLSGAGVRTSAAVVQSVRFLFSTGNITSGTIDHYTRPVQ